MPAATHSPGDPFSRLAAALRQNTDDLPERALHVDGTLPAPLDGTLYRNGPGVFRRGDRRNTTVLDGDGFVQRLRLHEGGARYSRRMVRTPKFQREQASGRFEYASWTTRAPGLLRNLGGRVPSQASITTYMVGDHLHALDEVAPVFELDPDSLRTRGPATLGLPHGDRFVKAHARRMAGSGDWVFVSAPMGRHGMQLHLLRQHADGRRTATPPVQAPRMVYFHDFAVTERHAIFILQPAYVRVLRFLAGWSTFRDCLQWRPDEGNRILVVNMDSGASQQFDAPACWVWHLGNAWESGSEIVLDFVGYDSAEQLLGPHAHMAALMDGQRGHTGGPGTLRRYVLNRANGTLSETLLASGNHEFPSIDPRTGARQHQKLYTASSEGDGLFYTRLSALDTQHGRMTQFDFGPQTAVSEPVFAPRSGDRPDAGWLITQTFDLERQTTAFAILDAERLGDGPLATVALDHAVPMALHGCWVAGQRPLEHRP